MVKTLARKRALVLGAHRGAGAASAIALGQAGAALVCADRRLAGETVATIRAAGGRAETWQCDIADEDSVAALFDGLGESGLPLDIALAAIAAPADPAFSASGTEALDRALGETLRGGWLATRGAARAMQGRGGCILLVLPDPGASAMAGAVAAALAGLVPAWSRETGPATSLAAIAPVAGAPPEAAARLALALASQDGRAFAGQVLTARGAG